ncbi:fumarylacetoacetate hydrolase family protein [Histidinibacterium lentulum]|uniref:FAA hydrolase family protein n=1 Tax=Histidinibacterium lentulum TaxID=2480588 RepID=A0A3N2QYF4_9RHOB|nr:fumarylacetoacetate hydrolase family protein [Histidinibacterium lentulum]ROU00138.1 FAA hydrolase family protein [Histidinibacterium lentulum]
MSGWVFPPPEPPSLPAPGGRYPVRRIFCIGRNYAAHAAELGNAVAPVPWFFTKTPMSLAQSGSVLPYPPGTEDYHHEVELVVALGEGGAPWGWASGLDMTRRDLQARAKADRLPWDAAKDVEGGAVIGTLSDEAPGPEARIALDVNGETRQDARIGDMVWPVAALLTHLSGLYTLGPGDLVMTGTPAGVGPVRPGDRLEGRIDGLAPVRLEIAP